MAKARCVSAQVKHQMCGPSGKVTGRVEFVKLMKAHPEVLTDLMSTNSACALLLEATPTSVRQASAFLPLELLRSWALLVGMVWNVQLT